MPWRPGAPDAGFAPGAFDFPLVILRHYLPDLRFALSLRAPFNPLSQPFNLHFSKFTEKYLTSWYCHAIFQRLCQAPAPTLPPGRALSSGNLFRPFCSTPLLSNSYVLFCATGNMYLLFFQSLLPSFYCDGGCRVPTLQNLDYLPPIPFHFKLLRTLFAFFCTHQKLNPFVFKRFRTLRQKTKPSLPLE